MKPRPLFSTLVHLRLPFSFFLLPIFLFGVIGAHHPDPFRLWAAFFIIHFLLYPASHAFNTWYDKDTDSIGLLKTPPPVHRSLFHAAWILDLAALAASAFLGWFFLACLALYTLGSKLYSWKVTRLKRRPIAGWVGVGLFQGALTYLAVVQTIGFPHYWGDPLLWAGAAIAAFFLWGVYPITQVYQHEEDERHGDLTISRLVGIRGTFILSASFLAFAVGLFVLYFVRVKDLPTALLFLVVQSPTLVFFLVWVRQVWKNPKAADFRRTMVMNFLASGLMNAFFLEILFTS